MKYLSYILLLLILIYASSCNEGLRPPDSPGFLTGKIIYKGGKDNWKSSDSIISVRLAALKVPLSDNLINDILAGNAIFNFLSFPLYVDEQSFEFQIDNTPQTLYYIAVVMQTSSSDFYKQKVIGVYNLSGDNAKPSQLIIESAKKSNIEIVVDWDNLPPQPF